MHKSDLQVAQQIFRQLELKGPRRRQNTSRKKRRD